MEAPKDVDLRYRDGDTPWELGRPDNTLREFVENWPIVPGKALEIGCGTGHNALWLAGVGFDTFGLDLSSEAIQLARQRAHQTKLTVHFEQGDFLVKQIREPPFSFAFDRGCFHLMESAEQRDQFAGRLARYLEDNGLWLSLVGSEDAPKREGGPPRRTARQIVSAVEPYFEIQLLRASVFDSASEMPPKCWQCLMRKRPKGIRAAARVMADG